MHCEGAGRGGEGGGGGGGSHSVSLGMVGWIRGATARGLGRSESPAGVLTEALQ